MGEGDREARDFRTELLRTGYENRSFDELLLSPFCDRRPQSPEISKVAMNNTCGLNLVVLESKLRNSILQVHGPGNKGTAFLVCLDEKSCGIVSNHHVVKDEAQVELSFRGRDRRIENGVIAPVLAVDQKNDLSLLGFDSRLFSELQPISLSGKVPEANEPVLAAGHSDGIFEQVFSPGKFLGLLKPEQMGVSLKKDRWRASENEFTSDVKIRTGNSGGPLVNAEGALIGVNVRLVPGASSAVPNSKLKEFLEINRDKLSPLHSSPESQMLENMKAADTFYRNGAQILSSADKPIFADSNGDIHVRFDSPREGEPHTIVYRHDGTAVLKYADRSIFKDKVDLVIKAETPEGELLYSVERDKSGIIGFVEYRNGEKVLQLTRSGAVGAPGLESFYARYTAESVDRPDIEPLRVLNSSSLSRWVESRFKQGQLSGSRTFRMNIALTADGRIVREDLTKRSIGTTLSAE